MAGFSHITIAIHAAIILCVYALFSIAAFAGQRDGGDWLLRARAVTYQPQERSHITPIGGRVSVNHIESPELDLTYFLTRNIAIEGLVGLINPDFGVRDTSVGNRDVGDVWVAAPTAILQIHPLSEDKVSPYFGAGLTYAIFFNVDSKNVDNINYRDNLGYVLQVGADYNIDDRWSLNADLKKVFIGSHISANSGSVNSKVDFDPLVIGVGVGYRF